MAVVLVSFFPLFLKGANEALAKRSISDAQLPNALRQWSRVHAARTLVSVCALGFASIASTY